MGNKTSFRGNAGKLGLAFDTFVFRSCKRETSGNMGHAVIRETLVHVLVNSFAKIQLTYIDTCTSAYYSYSDYTLGLLHQFKQDLGCLSTL